MEDLKEGFIRGQGAVGVCGSEGPLMAVWVGGIHQVTLDN